ncbi:hypothetical protein BJY04DRAFT_180049 [Aspergillus karnatakaensis]|uniref:class I adenylate-forming enzyme family protein n=1 Tax=Aspergillus karnatakaensis TaxID=1810916 RepID=UPI003CCCA58E
MPSSTLSSTTGGPPPPTPLNLWSWLTSSSSKIPTAEALIGIHQPATYLSNFLPKPPLSPPSSPSSSQSSESKDHFAWNYHQLTSAAEHVASAFASAGVSPGDVVAVFLNNSLEWCVLLWACFRLGAVFAPVDPTSVGRSDELKYLLFVLTPKVVVLEDESAADRFENLELHNSGSDSDSGSPVLKLLATTNNNDNPTAKHWALFSSLTSQNTTQRTLPPPTEAPTPDSTAMIIFTSGTTSFPKGCPLTARNIISEITSYHSFAHSNWSPNSRFLATSRCFRPICYLGCLNSWVAGGTVLMPSQERFFGDADAILDAVSAERVSHLMVTPAQVRMLAKSAGECFNGEGDEGLKSKNRSWDLKFMTCSGDTCTKDVIEDAERKLGLEKRRIAFHWGMSEGAPLFGWTEDNIPSAGRWEVPATEKGNIPALGRTLPGTSVRIVESRDAAADNSTAGATEIQGESEEVIVLRGQIGELQVHSTSLISRYLSEGHTDKAFIEDPNGIRWFKTGDLAYMDDSGRVFIVGRSKDLIVCKAFNIVPSIVEDCLEKELKEEAQVVGIKDERVGERAIAVLKSGINGDGNNGDDRGGNRSSSGDGCMESRVTECVARVLGPQYTLGGVVSLHDLGLDDWPKNSSQKIVKRDLVNAVEERRDKLGF